MSLLFNYSCIFCTERRYNNIIYLINGLCISLKGKPQLSSENTPIGNISSLKVYGDGAQRRRHKKAIILSLECCISYSLRYIRQRKNICIQLTFAQNYARLVGISYL